MPLRHLFLTLTALAVLPALADTAAPRSQWHAGIERGYQHLASTSAGLETSARAYCDDPTDQTRSDLEAQWRDAFLAWQAVRFVDFGPIEQDSLAWQFQFWPDPKNLIARKANYYLDLGKPVAAEDVNEAGVAVQGFPMVEYLLFDPRLGEGDRALPADKACSLLGAVTAHLAGNATRVADAWGDLEPRYMDTPLYRDTTVESGMAALALLEERRLGAPMGLRGSGKRSIYEADAWRSGQSMAAIEASLQGLYDAFLPGLETALVEVDRQALADRIRAQFEETLVRFDNLPASMAPLLDDDRFGELQGLYADLAQLSSLVSDQAGPALGVVRGFNSSDGD